LVEVELFLVEVEVFLVEVELFLVEVESFLVEVESFLVEVESFLVTTQPTSSVDKKRKLAIAAQQKQAERIVKRSRVIMKDCTVGDNVAVPIPSVDRGRGDVSGRGGVISGRG
jgi:hypothetical protein